MEGALAGGVARASVLHGTIENCSKRVYALLVSETLAIARFRNGAGVSGHHDRNTG